MFNQLKAADSFGFGAGKHVRFRRNGVDPGAQPRGSFLAYTGPCGCFCNRVGYAPQRPSAAARPDYYVADRPIIFAVSNASPEAVVNPANHPNGTDLMRSTNGTRIPGNRL